MQRVDFSLRNRRRREHKKSPTRALTVGRISISVRLLATCEKGISATLRHFHVALEMAENMKLVYQTASGRNLRDMSLREHFRGTISNSFFTLCQEPPKSPSHRVSN